MIKNRIKFALYFCLFAFIVITIITFKSTYALFENDATGIVDNTIGKWIIKVSDALITSGQTEDIVIDSFIYEQKQTVENGYIAPGSSAYFDLVLLDDTIQNTSQAPSNKAIDIIKMISNLNFFNYTIYLTINNILFIT